MLPESDIASAAQRLAAHAREAPPQGDLDDDLRTLLPLLDAVGAGATRDRAERFARAICIADRVDPDHLLGGATPLWLTRVAAAHAAIAVADADEIVRAAETV